jgi:plasmid stability protein
MRMAQLVVRNLEDNVKTRLRRRANRHGRSMEEEVREILRSAAALDEVAAVPLGTRISARFRKIGLDEEIEELRGTRPKPAVFKSR